MPLYQDFLRDIKHTVSTSLEKTKRMSFVPSQKYLHGVFCTISRWQHIHHICIKERCVLTSNSDCTHNLTTNYYLPLRHIFFNFFRSQFSHFRICIFFVFFGCKNRSHFLVEFILNATAPTLSSIKIRSYVF